MIERPRSPLTHRILNLFAMFLCTLLCTCPNLKKHTIKCTRERIRRAKGKDKKPDEKDVAKLQEELDAIDDKKDDVVVNL